MPTLDESREKRKDTIPTQHKVVIEFVGEWPDNQLDIPNVGFSDKIVAPYPDDGIDINFASNWENDIQNILDVTKADTALQKLLGVSLRGILQRNVGEKNIYTWKGVEPVKISMNLDFVFHSDPLYDVIQPAFQLASTQLPNRLDFNEESQSVFIERPVEASADSTRFVQVHIGRWLTFPAILPTKASPSFSGVLSTSPSNLRTCYPQEVTVDFEFIGSTFPEKGDMGFDVNTFNFSEEDRTVLQELSTDVAQSSSFFRV